MLEESEMDLPERWSAKRKSEIVLRLLRGEDLGELSRGIQLPPPVIEQWREAFLSGAEAGLKKRAGDPLEREITRTRAKLGETMMKLETSRDAPGKKGAHGRPQEAQETRFLVSPATGKRYPLTVICSVWRVARSSVYARRTRTRAGASPSPTQKRGPKTRLSDAELVEEIRTVLKDSRFLGEGHKKVTIRLRHKGIPVGKNRVLRLMREKRLSGPGQAAARARGSHAQRYDPHGAPR